MPTIEFGLMVTKPDHAVMDPSSPSSHILRSAWSAVTHYSTGPHWAYGGVEPTDPSSLWWFFEFDSVAHHEQFARTHGMEAVRDLPKILSGQEFQKHVEIEGDLRKVFDAPVIQVLLTYFPASITDLEKDLITSKAHNIVSAGVEACSDAKAVRFGWSCEKDFPVLDRKEEVGRVLVVFVGWTSVDAAEKYWEENELAKEFEDILKIRESLDMVSRFVSVRKFGDRAL